MNMDITIQQYGHKLQKHFSAFAFRKHNSMYLPVQTLGQDIATRLFFYCLVCVLSQNGILTIVNLEC